MSFKPEEALEDQAPVQPQPQISILRWAQEHMLKDWSESRLVRFMEEGDKVLDETPKTEKTEARKTLNFKPEEALKDPAPVQTDKATPIEDPETPKI